MTRRETDDRYAAAWYVQYPGDAYALGPLRFQEPVSAARAMKEAESQFGELPREVWPDGRVEEGQEYEYELWDEVSYFSQTM